MKTKLIRRFMGVVAASAMLVTCLGVGVAAADDEVIYQGSGRGEVVVSPGTPSDPKDLFGSEMKNLMPGDTITKSIALQNNGSRRITFYMKAEAAASSQFATDAEKSMSDDLMNKMTLEIAVRNQSGGEPRVLYQGPASGDPSEGVGTTGDLVTQYIQLASVSAQQGAVLDVTLSVPKSLGNEYQDGIAKVNWLFQCEGTSGGGGGPDNPGRPDNPGGPDNPPGDNPGEEIPDEDLPYGGGDDDVPGPAPGGDDTVLLEDEEVPMAGLPDSDVLIVVDDSTLGNLPKTGGFLTTGMAAIVFLPLLVVGLGLLTYGERRRKAKQK